MKTVITIQNLKCGGCANTIIKKISALKSVSEVEVDNEANTVVFKAENEAAIVSVTEQLKILGYPSIKNTNSILSKAKSFVSCATGRINK